jgi:hypothetical protein
MGWTPPPDDGIDVPEWKCHLALEPEGASTMQITTVGLDLAKNVFVRPESRLSLCVTGGVMA